MSKNLQLLIKFKTILTYRNLNEKGTQTQVIQNQKTQEQ